MTSLDFLIYPLVCTLLYSFLSLLYFNKIVVEPHHQVAQPDETMIYEDNIDEEEARVDIDLRRFSSDHHYQVESNE